MKKYALLLVSIFVLIFNTAKAQTPTNQDCLGAIAICQNIYTESNAYSGTGNYLNEIDTLKSCLKSGEKNDVWYTFTVQTGGSLCFTITPNLSTDDYDWAVYNLSSNSCSDIFSNGSIEVSCNYASDPGATGPNGLAGPQNEACITVTAGELFVINVSQFSPSPNGYTIDFSSSTADIFDNITPAILTVDTPIFCGETSLTFHFSENVLCNTVQDGDFVLVGPGGPYTLSGVTGAACSSGGTQELTYSITVSPAINSGGSFNLCLTSGSGVTDLCGNVAPSACLPFTVAGLTIIETSHTDVICFGADDGAATVDASGGTSPYTYTWATSPAQTGATVTGLGGGIYSVTAVDADGCSGTTTVSISEPTVIPTNFDVTCDSAGCDGSASVLPLGGTSPYSYQWYDDVMNPIGGETSSSISNLCAGAWSVVVTDAAGCKDTIIVIILLPTITISPQLTGCPGACDGVAPVTAIGGVAPYTYEWQNPLGTPIAGQTDSILDSVCAGQYYLQVTTGNACVLIDSVTIADPDTIDANISSFKDACFGVCDGSATVGVSGGTPPYTYTLDDSLTQATAIATGLCPGSYTVVVTDSKGCGPDTASVTIGENPLLTSTITSFDNSDCDSVNGTATVTAGGGSTPYSYSWNNPGSATTASVSGLSVGTYIVVVTDSATCTDTSTVSLGYADSAIATITVVQAISCNGACDGELTVTITNGIAPFTYSWSTKDVTPNVDSLCSDTVTVTATDSIGCPATASIIMVEPPPIVIDSTQSTNLTSCGSNDGTATAYPSGGTSLYSYTWDDSATQTTQTATGLTAGTYNVTVTDANNCPPATASITITEPPLQIDSTSSVDETTCNSKDGTATAYPSGGVNPYTYQWSDPDSQSTATATGLSAGTYTVTVSDPNGCTPVTATVTLNPPPPITLTITSVDETTCNSKDGTATVTPSNGATPYTYTWSDPSSQNTQTATGLTAGIYTVTVTDINSCPQVTATVTLNPPPPITVSFTKTDVTCNGGANGTIDMTVANGEAPYTHTWSNGATTEDLTGLTVGTYTDTVTDINNCPVTVQSVTITEPGPLTASTSQVCEEGKGHIDLTITGGITPYTISWSGPGGFSSSSEDIDNLEPGTYTVTVKVHDTLNCDPVTAVETIPPCDIEIPTAFTPNGNGQNDDWQIKNLELFPNCKVKVYNRWGDLVFSSKGYEKPWDGKHRLTGIDLPMAVYYYVIELNVEGDDNPNDDQEQYVKQDKGTLYGYVTIVK